MNSKIMALFRQLRRTVFKVQSVYDRHYHDDHIPRAKYVGRENWQKHLYALAAHPGFRVLEVGSSIETGQNTSDRANFYPACYIGFDIRAGPNVDVVGDAHQLSNYFSPQDKFDLIYSAASFEHFAMPWIVAAEMAKMLKTGGYVFVETMFSFPSHCRPWHFYHFSDLGLRALFPESLGIEHVDSGMSGPIVGRWTALAEPHLVNRIVPGLYAYSEFLGTKIRDVPNFNWNNISTKDISGSTEYPGGTE